MKESLDALRGESPPIVAIRSQVMQLLARQSGARRLPPVLILGETGTGKGLLARAIHHASPRHGGPFVDVNCAAIPETLLEAELFGYERGAFTDARQAKPGLFQTADKGTLFLDEIGLLPAALQSKLLTVLEDRAVRRLGAIRPEPVSVALVAATSVDLKRAVRDGSFRGDLYHRLAVISLELPPLRARGADVLALARHFLVRACADYGLAPRALTPGACDKLIAYRWPGNVRELANAIERAVLLSDADEITAGMLDFLTDDRPTGESIRPAEARDPAITGELDDALRARIEAALRDRGGNIRSTARDLGISRNTLRTRMDKYGLRHHGASRVSPNRRRAESRSKARGATPGQWERRHLAFLRARLLSASSVASSRALDVIADKVRSFGGRIEDSSPTGVVAVFGLEPVDNAPSHAARTALAIQNATADARAEGEGAAVIIALHCADHLVRRDESGLQIGVDEKAGTWSTLETLVAGDRPNVIVVSSAVVPFLTRRFALERFREVEGDVWVVHRREGAAVAGSTTRFVGRTAELETLRHARARVEQRQGQIVGIVGEAGIGKSRLLYEAVRQLQDWLVLAAGGAPYTQNTSYFPLVEFFKSYCQIQDTDAATAVREKVARKLPAGAGDPVWLLPPILDLLGVLPPEDPFHRVDPPQRRHRMHDAIKQVLLATSAEQPLCLIIEDLHWIDAPTQAVVDLLTESIAGARVLLLVTYRPEYQHGWGSRSNYTQVRLDPFPREDVDELLAALLGRDPSLDAVKQMLRDRTEGNPFFIEECTRALAEAHNLIGEVAQYRLGTTLRHISLPLTVQAVIATRLNRLAADEKTVLQSAAVIGKDVRIGILRAVAGSDVAFDAALLSLRRAEFIHETRGYPDLEYTFKHGLTHEVVYHSLLPEPRRELHARIVDVIERLHHDRLAEHVERLAHHALRAEQWDKAVTYLRRAGTRATDRLAYHEARAAYEQALDALDRLPESRQTQELAVDLRFELRTALLPLGEFGQVGAVLRVAERLASSLGETHRQAMANIYVVVSHYVAAEHEPALLALHRAQALGEALGDVGLQSVASMYQGYVHCARADFAQAVGFLQRCKDLLAGDLAKQRFGQVMIPAITSRAFLAWGRAELGDFETAVEVGEEGLHLAEAAGHTATLVTMNWGTGMAYARRGRAERALPLLERALDICRRGSPFYLHYVGAALGPAYALGGDSSRAIALLEETAAHDRRIGFMAHHALTLTSLGDVYAMVGHLDEAAAQAEQALAMARTRGEPGHEAYALRLVGEISARREPAQAVEASDAYRWALTLAEKLRMRPLVAHCHLGLGKLYLRTNKREQAREHLTIATTMYRDMGMTYWLERAEAEATELG